MTWHSPEEKGKGCHTGRDKDGDPYRAAKEKFLHVRLANSKRAERRRLGLAEENKDRVQLILMGYQEKDGDGERKEKLRVTNWSRE